MTHQHAVDTLAAERYLLDEMSDIERHDFEAHFFGCEECAGIMRLGHQLRTDAKALFPSPIRAREENRRVAPAWWQQPWRTAVPWAAAAMLAIALVVQLRTPPPSTSDELATTYEPVSLRPVSRGAVTVVPAPAAGERAALALEVNIGAPGDPIAYTLTRDNGNSVLSGRATVPAPGVPLVLLVPGGQLTAGSSYVLTLTAAGDSAARPAEYRFDVAAR
jgi:Putative zinc-finger